MRILYYNRMLNEPVGGGLHARGLISAWRSLGHTVTCWPPENAVVSASDVGRYRFLPELIRVPGLDIRARIRLIRETARLSVGAAESCPEIVVARRAAYDYTLDAFQRSANVPVVAEVNAVLSAETRSNGGEWYLPWERKREAGFMERAERVVCVSDDVAEQVNASLGFTREIRIVSNGVNPDRFSPDVDVDESIRRTLPAEVFVVGYCGSLSANHDPGALRRAMRSVLSAVPTCRFLFVGPGMDELRNNGFEQELLDRTLATGVVPNEKVPSLLVRSDVFMGALRHSHGSPLKLFEYMSMGRPVAFAAGGQTAHIIAASGCGWCSPEGDSEGLATSIIRAASTDSQMLEFMGSSGRNWILENATWSKVAERMIEGLGAGRPVGEAHE